jgi:hypothetical protein
MELHFSQLYHRTFKISRLKLFRWVFGPARAPFLGRFLMKMGIIDFIRTGVWVLVKIFTLNCCGLLLILLFRMVVALLRPHRCPSSIGLIPLTRSVITRSLFLCKPTFHRLGKQFGMVLLEVILVQLPG